MECEEDRKMLGYMLLAVWTAACIVGGVILGRTQGGRAGNAEARGGHAGTTIPETGEGMENDEAMTRIKTQWENLMCYDGTKRGQTELDK